MPILCLSASEHLMRYGLIWLIDMHVRAIQYAYALLHLNYLAMINYLAILFNYCAIALLLALEICDLKWFHREQIVPQQAIWKHIQSLISPYPNEIHGIILGIWYYLSHKDTLTSAQTFAACSISRDCTFAWRQHFCPPRKATPYSCWPLQQVTHIVEGATHSSAGRYIYIYIYIYIYRGQHACL